VLDGYFGINRMEQTVTGPDYGNNVGTDRYGIPARTATISARADPLLRHHGRQGFTRGTDYDFGTTPNWMPLFRTEQSFTFSTGLTKVMTKHELRFGVDVVKHELNHYQAEFGSIGGVRGRFSFGNDLTSTPGYVSPGWNSFGGFLLGLQTTQAKDVQDIQMTAASGRWPPTPRSLDDRAEADAEPGPALRVLPADDAQGQRHRAARPLTYEVLLGGAATRPRTSASTSRASTSRRASARCTG
jgi:hypothetical protein